MSKLIRMGIVGWGNIGRAAKVAIEHNRDCSLEAIVTRRSPSDIDCKDIKVLRYDDVESLKDSVDVLLLCGGSKSDLPVQTPELSQWFNTVDTFDTHANIPEHLKNVDEAARRSGHTSIISAGWDPGLFSMARLIGRAALPCGNDYTFWGRGVSQGHSDAIRRIEGVKNAIQYTVPVDEAVRAVRAGENPQLTTRQKHTRECYVVLKDGADPKKVEHDIVTMKNYFSDYDTTVYFVSEEELKRDHSAMPHAGSVIRSGNTSDQNGHVVEFSLKLDSNPEFTSSVLVAFARACARLNAEGTIGGLTPFDIPLRYLSPVSRDELIAEIM